MPSESAPPETAAVADALLETLEALATELHRAPPARGLTLDSSLERDFGFDSLGRVELVLRVEQRFGVRLSEHLLATAETPRDVLRAILAPTAAAALPVSVEAVHAQVGTVEGEPSGATTLVEVLAWHRDRHADRRHLFLLDDQVCRETLTYGELWAGAIRVARGLRAGGGGGGEGGGVVGARGGGGDPPPAVHVGQHGRAEGRHPHPRQPPGEHPRDGAGGPGALRRRHGQLAAALSRHGVDRRVAGEPVLRRAAGRDVAADVSGAARALAAGHSRLPGHDFGRAQLRLRAVRAEDRRRRARRAGPLVVAARGERRGADQPGHDDPLHRAVFPVRIPPRDDGARLRPRRILGRARLPAA